mmetsp:Transcript_8675/g.22387  ORF Transcript_8675/g.22387 Transcript_8675/m.22387 type:complete len:349 (-) Transcript_8675:134-1180(-)
MPVPGIPAFKQRNLWVDHRRCYLMHPQAEVGCLVLEALEERVVAGTGRVALIQVFVRAGGKNGSRSHLVVVCHQETALTRVDHLVRLSTEACSDGSVGLGCSGRDSVPRATQTVSAVLDERDVMLLADLTHPGHVAQASPHVGNDDNLCPRGHSLALEVLTVNDVLVGGVDVDRLAPGVHDCARHGRKCECVGEDLDRSITSSCSQPFLLLLQDGIKCEENGAATRVEAHTVLVSRGPGEGLLSERHIVQNLVCIARVGRDTAVTEQPPSLHDLRGALNAGLGDWHGLLDVRSQSRGIVFRLVGDGVHVQAYSTAHEGAAARQLLLSLCLLAFPGHKHGGHPRVLLGA